MFGFFYEHVLSQKRKNERKEDRKKTGKRELGETSVLMFGKSTVNSIFYRK